MRKIAIAIALTACSAAPADEVGHVGQALAFNQSYTFTPRADYLESGNAMWIDCRTGACVVGTAPYYRYANDFRLSDYLDMQTRQVFSPNKAGYYIAYTNSFRGNWNCTFRNHDTPVLTSINSIRVSYRVQTLSGVSGTIGAYVKPVGGFASGYQIGTTGTDVAVRSIIINSPIDPATGLPLTPASLGCGQTEDPAFGWYVNNSAGGIQFGSLEVTVDARLTYL